MSTTAAEPNTLTSTYRDAINRGLADALQADERVFLLGEDIAAAGGAFKVTSGLMERFGSDRVLDTPISEQAILGAAIGAALRGLRPLAELMFADFSGVCFDSIVNEMAKYRYMTGGQVELPLVVRMANGAGGGFAAQHSQTCENWFVNVPGLKILCPSTARDAYGLLRSAFDDPNPVLYFEHKNLFNTKFEFDTDPQPVPIGVAELVTSGTDITIVANQLMRVKAEEAVRQLSAAGIAAELIDPRTIVPFDFDAVINSVARTNRLLVVQEAWYEGSWGSSLISRVVDQQFELLDAPPRLLSSRNAPTPYATNLEMAWLPQAPAIVAAATEIVAY
jgi:pyruvate dehydrogenase E1 component beta subunit